MAGKGGGEANQNRNHHRDAGRTKRHSDSWCARGAAFPPWCAVAAAASASSRCPPNSARPRGTAAGRTANAPTKPAKRTSPAELRRQLRALRRQLAGYERVLERIAAQPGCEPVVLAALRDEVSAGYARLLANRHGHGGPPTKIT